MLFGKKKITDYEKLFISNLPWYPVMDEKRFREHPITDRHALSELYRHQDGAHTGLAQKVRNQLGLNWFYLDFYRCRLFETFVLMTLENSNMNRNTEQLISLSRRIQTREDLAEELNRYGYSEECRSAAYFAQCIHEGVFAAVSEELRQELNALSVRKEIDAANKPEKPTVCAEAAKKNDETEAVNPSAAEQRDQSLANFFKQNDIRTLNS